MDKNNPRKLLIGAEGATEAIEVTFGVPVEKVEDITKVLKDYSEAEQAWIKETMEQP